MKYDKEMIENLIESYDAFKTHVENVLIASGNHDDIHSIDGVYGDDLNITTSSYRCGSTDYEDCSIPLTWLAADPEELRNQIEEKRERDREELRRRHEEQQRIETARRETSERVQLAALKAKYEPTNQGETA